MIRTGVGFYAFFGLGWLLAGVGHFGGTTVGVTGVVGLVIALALIWVARRLSPPGRAGEASEGSEESDESEESDSWSPLTRRRFGQVNAVQWLAIVVIAVGCGTGGVPELIMPLVAVVVGIHFSALARVFDDRRLHVPGAMLTALGIAGLVARAAGASSGAVFTLVGVGSALILWSTAAWSIARESQEVQT